MIARLGEDGEIRVVRRDPEMGPGVRMDYADVPSWRRRDDVGAILAVIVIAIVGMLALAGIESIVRAIL